MSRTKTLILGAAGRDFLNFISAIRNDADAEVEIGESAMHRVASGFREKYG